MIISKEIVNLSNGLSLLRLLIAVPIWFLLDNLYQNNWNYILAAIALFAALTDIADGYAARRYNQITEFGKIIDPIADKVVIGALVIKLYLLGEIPTYFLLMILIRDILIFLGGIVLAKKLKRVLPSNMLGKVSVIIISIVILLVILQVDRTTILFKSFYLLSILLIIVSFIGYVLRAVEFLKQENYGSV